MTKEQGNWTLLLLATILFWEWTYGYGLMIKMNEIIHLLEKR